MRANGNWVLSIALAVCCLSAQADNVVRFQSNVLISPDATISDAVRNECKLEEVLAERIFEQIKRRNPGAVKVDPSKLDPADAYLRVTVVHVGGNAAASRIEIRAESVRAGKVIADRKVRSRTSIAYIDKTDIGMCASVARMATELGGRMSKVGPRLLKGAAKATEEEKEGD